MIDLRLADSTELLKQIPDRSIDAIITDPPYGCLNREWDQKQPFMRDALRVIKSGRVVSVFANMKYAVELINENPKYYRYDIVWKKSCSQGFLDCNRRPMRAHEFILIFADGNTLYNPQKTSGKPYVRNRFELKSNYHISDTEKFTTVSEGGRYPTDVLEFKSVGNRIHNTQKPLELMEWLVKTYTNEGDTVLDPFMGSGTTGVACKKLKRNFIGVEINEGFYNIAKERIEKE